MATSTPSVASATVVRPGTSSTAASNGSASNVPSFFPLYDAFLDIPHPGASSPPSSIVNEKRVIVAPPPQAFAWSRDVGMELANEKGIQNIIAFCFPEHRMDQNQANAQNNSAHNPNSLGLTRYDMYLQDYYFSSRSKGPTYHSFAMQLSSGDRVYGHVRRYFPYHTSARSRIDVGRRAERAMVLLTRAPGGTAFYHSLLKSIEAISSHSSSLFQDEDDSQKSRPQESFLHQAHTEHANLVQRLQASIQQQSTINPTLVSLLLNKVEFDLETFNEVDFIKFVIPTSLLLASPSTSTSSTTTGTTTDSPILPLLRCIGLAHTIRLVTALLCERRVILVSSSTSRLSSCANAATSILSQGLLHWQHIYVPILPPSMLHFLAAPMPYLIGITQNHAHLIENTQGLGEVLVVYLDENDLKVHNIKDPDSYIPEILRPENMYMQQQQQQYPPSPGGMYPQQQYPMQPPQVTSIAEILKADLLQVIKDDRKLRRGNEPSATNTGVAVAKGKAFIKQGFGKLKHVAKKKLGSAGSGGSGMQMTGQIDNNAVEDPPGNESAIADPVSTNDIYSYGEGFVNEEGEESVRNVFATFFLCLIGDMRWYLRPSPQQGGAPTFDKDLFLQSRMKLGDTQNSPMYDLLVHFKESQIFEQFAKERMKEVLARTQPTANSPLFYLTLNHHRAHRVEFKPMEVKRSVRSIGQKSPANILIETVSGVRKRAMAITSNNRDDAAAAQNLRHLVEDCREGSIILVEVMNVIWERIRDSRGMQWKHGLFALQMLQELLFHGPFAAVTEATDGLDKIRRMKYYENMRNAVGYEIRRTAIYIYGILVNRKKLFSVRRVCALSRKMMKKKKQYFPRRDTRLHNVVYKSKYFPRFHDVRFKQIHAWVKPGAGLAPSGDLLGVENAVPTPIVSTQQQSFGSDQLLSVDFAVAPTTNGAPTSYQVPSLVSAAPQFAPTIAAIPPAPAPSNQQTTLTSMMGNATISSNITASSSQTTFPQTTQFAAPPQQQQQQQQPPLSPTGTTYPSQYQAQQTPYSPTSQPPIAMNQANYPQMPLHQQPPQQQAPPQQTSAPIAHYNSNPQIQQYQQPPQQQSPPQQASAPIPTFNYMQHQQQQQPTSPKPKSNIVFDPFA